jgi:hypothetical protein
MPPSEAEKVLAVASLVVKTNQRAVLDDVEIVVLVEVLFSIREAAISVVLVDFRDIFFAVLVIFLSVRVSTKFFLARVFILIASSVGVSSKG